VCTHTNVHTQEAEAAHQEAMSHLSDKLQAKIALLEKQVANLNPIKPCLNNTTGEQLRDKY
jgi:uncharacterized protein YceH (UPF0502 family)